MDSETKGFLKLAVSAFVGVILLVIVLGSFGTVSAGQVGVKTRLGRVVGNIQPGLYFKVPFIDGVHKIDVKTRTVNYDKNGNEGDTKDTSELSSASQDLQEVKTGVVVTYHINPQEASNIYTQYSSTENYEYNVIEPAIRETVKSTSAKYTAEELVTKRSDFSETVNKLLTERFATKNAVLDTFSVTNFEFSPSFAAAIEAKVTATQNAEAAKNKLEQVKFEAQQKIETAKADAESIRIQAQAVTSQGGEDYVKLQALKVWDGHGCTSSCFAQGTQMPVPFLNLK